MNDKPWVCSNFSIHRFTTEEAEENSYFCTICPYGDGILINDPEQPSGQGTSPVSPTSPQEDLGLCILLLDCSGSMNDPAFQNNPVSKKELIARSVAAGIFSLSGNPQRKFAYVLILGFDHNTTTLLPYTSIEDIVNQYETAPELEKKLKEEMFKKDGLTDINSALSIAFNFTEQFINSKISVLGFYKPRIQAVFDQDMMSHLIPNVRVLLFTDGLHYLGGGNDTLNPSPFKDLKYDNKVFDLLMGAYYGANGEPGYHQLKSLISKCPRHPQVDQFFLFDHPSKVSNLKGLFRMASGASGFCPKCLEEANTVVR